MRFFKKNPDILVFYLYLVFIFIFEGFGLRDGHIISHYLTLVVPLPLFLLLSRRKRLEVPLILSFLFTVFFILSIVSTITSIDVQNSFDSLMLYLSLFLIFLYVWNAKDQVVKLLPYFLISAGLIFSIASNVVYITLILFHYNIVPAAGYNLFYPGFQDHNHLGVYLIIPLILCINFIIQDKKRSLFIILSAYFYVLFLFSFSLSAYLSCFVTIISSLGFYLYKKQDSFRNKLFLMITTFIIWSVIILFVLVILPKKSQEIPLFSSLHTLFTTQFGLKEKVSFVNRTIYASYALSSIVKKPFFGIGPGNFSYASDYYRKDLPMATNTSHNIFIDIVTDLGVIAGIITLIIIAIIVLFSSKNIYAFLLLALLVDFQTDYSFLMFSLSILSIIFLALIFKSVKIVKTEIMLSLSLLIWIALILNSMSNLLINKEMYQTAFFHFPFNKELYQPLINGELNKGNYKNGLNYLALYKRLFSGDQNTYMYDAEIHLRYNEKLEALNDYKKAFFMSVYKDASLAKKIYDLENELYKKKQAEIFIRSYFQEIVDQKHRHYFDGIYYNNARQLCDEIYEECPYIF